MGSYTAAGEKVHFIKKHCLKGFFKNNAGGYWVYDGIFLSGLGLENLLNVGKTSVWTRARVRVSGVYLGREP